MKHVLFLISSVLAFTVSSQSYWQQTVNYSIDVKLIDEKHQLEGYESFEYINNSPNTLNELYIHIWPNAYKNKNTALAKQLYKDGNTLLHFGADSLKGWIDSLDFKVNDQKVVWEYDSEHIDIVKITLNSPLTSGGKITVTTPFHVQLPSGRISRLGHIGQSYQITQWYPKPAVYDKDGWHPIPYLNQGEFYSEYGSFDVRITLPENYVVGATGDLQTASEIEFLNEKAKTTAELIKGNPNLVGSEKFPESSGTFKTIRYTQSKVHDFAWFADKRYEVLKGEVELPDSKRKVTSWAMFTKANMHGWKNAIEYINDATYYYSLWNGDYPYNQVTAVDGTISAGGGMEYPNVTVIGTTSDPFQLEVVIVHEVGHNWFYGILGSNERTHGWMDEGLNTLNEVRYVQTKYPNNTAMSDMLLNGSFHMDHLNHRDLGDISYRMIAMVGQDQPIETHSAEFTSVNYGVIMYQKTGLVFNYLQQYLGDELFDKCMHSYYEKWKFKHPQPEDIQSVFEEVSGKKLDWLFYDLIQTTNHVDYKIKRVKKDGENYMVTVKNVGQIDGPYQVKALSSGLVVDSVMVEPGTIKQTFTLTGNEIDEVRIDPTKQIPELNRTNNGWYADAGIFKRFEKPTFEFLIGDHETDKNNIFWSPILGVNSYDKFMLGAVFHNYGIPFNHLQYAIAPMFSFGRQSASGTAEISYTFLPKKNLKLSKLGLSVKSYKNDSIFEANKSYFLSVAPYWTAHIGQRANNSPFTNEIRIQGLYRLDQLGPLQINHAGAFARYNTKYTERDFNVQSEVRLDYASNLANENQFLRASGEIKYKVNYWKRKKYSLELRAFGGGFLLSDFDLASYPNYAYSAMGASGVQDLFVEDYFFQRSGNRYMGAQQRLDNMGGIRSTSTAGLTDNWLTTANFYFQLPIKPSLLGLYADAGIVSTNGSTENLFVFGAAIRMGDVLGVYFPIYNNSVIENGYFSKDYKERIRFTLKLNLFNRSLDFSNFI